MQILGFSFQKGKIRYSLLELIDNAPSLKERGKVDYDTDLGLPDLAERWSLSLSELLAETKPNVVSALQVYESQNLDSAKFQIMPMTTVAHLCFQRHLPLKTYTFQSLRTGTSFGLPAKIKPIEEVDRVFGVHPPHWDDIQRRSVLVGWRALREASQ